MHENLEDNLTVSGDSTWKKFSSSFGIPTLFGYYSKKAVDATLKSSFCQACNHHKALIDIKIDEFNALYEGHKEDYSSKYTGSARKMEIDAITEIFGGSEEKYGVEYVK